MAVCSSSQWTFARFGHILLYWCYDQIYNLYFNYPILSGDRGVKNARCKSIWELFIVEVDRIRIKPSWLSQKIIICCACMCRQRFFLIMVWLLLCGSIYQLGLYIVQLKGSKRQLYYSCFDIIYFELRFIY